MKQKVKAEVSAKVHVLGEDQNFEEDWGDIEQLNLKMEQAISSSYNHQSNGQVEACIKFIKHIIKNALILKTYI